MTEYDNKRYTLTQIAEIIGGHFSKRATNIVINEILIDSRKLINGADALFFAMTGKNHDGHNYIEEMYRLGVKNFVIHQWRAEYELLDGACFITVCNVLSALQQLSAHKRKSYDNEVVGITGSNGKTVIKEWLFQLLHTKKNIVRSPKSYNSQIGVPLSVWLINERADLAIFEAGISQVGEMELLQKIIQPGVGIFSNIGIAHQENFTTLNEKVREKLQLFRQCKILIYCKEDKTIDREIAVFVKTYPLELFTWSYQENARLRILRVEKSAKGRTTITSWFKNLEREIVIPFADNASIENAIHCWCYLLYLKYDDTYIKEQMNLLSPVEMRLEIEEGINNCTLINDTYNSDLNSLKIAIELLHQQKQHTSKTIILSDILQTGYSDEIVYKKVASLLQQNKISLLIGIGERIKEHSSLFTTPNFMFRTVEEFLHSKAKEHLTNMAILLKGARKFRFENINDLLQKKNHATVLKIDLEAIVNNLNYFRDQLNPKTKIMAVVKALGYGSGAYEVASLLQFHGVNYLAVAFADEGVLLRKAGIKLPIMVMNPTENSFKTILEYHLEPEIYSFKILDQFYTQLCTDGVQHYPIHLKFDTGMKRLGFEWDEVDMLLNELKQKREIQLKSVFSHLAGSDSAVFDDFTKEQIKRFEIIKRKINHTLDTSILYHILNSAGIERLPYAQYDMVRIGIGLYGISVLNSPKIMNVSTLKTVISQIKYVKKGETIGYSRSGVATKNIRVGIIPIGYADGIDRRRGNGKGKVLINNTPAPFIGNICMDMCMVDLSELGKIKEGDTVIIFGEQYSIAELAQELNTIPYEILTNVSSRVKRIYYH